MIKFPDLTADDIEVRVSRVTEKPQGSGVELLLYKDARCDMRILDETVGNTNWQRTHEIRDGKNYCTVSIRDEQGHWVSKEDCGTAGNFEVEKSASSDAFKRACFNWGIGRELYTAPEIFLWQSNDGDIFKLDHKDNGKPACYDKFSVSQIIIEDHKIKAISIKNNSSGKYVYRWDGRE